MRYALIENGAVTNIIEMDKRNEQFFPSAAHKEGINVRVLRDLQHTTGQQLHHTIIQPFIVRSGVLKL
jgi:hypothetical protein